MPNFSPNTRSSSGMESFRAASRDMVIVVVTISVTFRDFGDLISESIIACDSVQGTSYHVYYVPGSTLGVSLRLSDLFHDSSVGSSVPLMTSMTGTSSLGPSTESMFGSC